ncbi:MAG: adenylate kinase [Clostridia bacterium]|nr:adenylate kinase [Clostridia bacterium]
MNMIMLGAQGTGKGTVAGILSEKLGIPQVSTGDIFRKHIKEETELGVEANKYIKNGQLVPDDITVPMVANRLEEDDAKNGVILDGFPRTIAQAEKLDEMLAKKGNKIDMVINLTTPRDEIIERILTRRVCSNQACKATYNLVMHPPKVEGICDKCGAELVQREDDTSEEAIRRRLAIYDEQTSPLVEYYEKKGVLRTEEVSTRINRLGDDVANDIVKEIKG